MIGKFWLATVFQGAILKSLGPKSEDSEEMKNS